MRASLETLFLRFRDDGDLRALAKVFDRTARDLLKVAHHLVRDPDDAEDVLQETFACAIERASSFDARRTLVPWLTGILVRQAALARRQAARVVEPDRLHERPPAPDPGERLAERELAASVQAALGRVPELYRAVLVPLLEEGQRPEQIARELGRAPGTVRMQIHRGLDLLRRALPAGVSAAVLGVSAPRGLAAVRSAVLEHAAATIGATAAPVAASGFATGHGLGRALLAGGLVMSKNGWLAAIGATLATGTAWLWLGPGSPGIAQAEGPETAVEAEVVATLPETLATLPEPGRSAPPADERAPSEARVTATAGGVWLVGTVAGVAPEHARDVRVKVAIRPRLDLAELERDVSQVVPPEVLAASGLVTDAEHSLRAASRFALLQAAFGDEVEESLDAWQRQDEPILHDGAFLHPVNFVEHGRLDSDGTFAVDLTECATSFANASEFLASWLGVRLEHELYMPASEAFRVAELTRATRFDGEERIELRVDSELRPAAVLRGRVATDERSLVHFSLIDGGLLDGEIEIGVTLGETPEDAFQGFAKTVRWLAPSNARSVRVALFPFLGGTVGEEPAAVTEPEFDGSFELRVPMGGTFALVAFDAELRPTTELVELELLAIEELEEELTFPESFALSGFVDDQGLVAGDGIVVRTERVTGPHDQRRAVEGTELVFDGVSFERLHHEATTEANGSFELLQLPPGLLHVDAGGLTGARALFEPGPDERVLVSAPGTGVRVDLRGALIALALTLDGAVLAEERREELVVTLARERDGERIDLSDAFDERGRLTVLVEPGEAYSLAASGPGLARWRSAFTAPEAGQQRTHTIALARR